MTLVCPVTDLVGCSEGSLVSTPGAATACCCLPVGDPSPTWLGAMELVGLLLSFLSLFITLLLFEGYFQFFHLVPFAIYPFFHLVLFSLYQFYHFFLLVTYTRF